VADRGRGSQVDRIREFVRAEVKRTSLRKVAAAAGVKLGATKKFVDGSVPYERNLRQWKRFFAHELHAGRAGKPDASLQAGDAAIALDMLLWGIPDEEHAAARCRAVAAFHTIHADSGVVPPQWVRDLLPGDDRASPTSP
jgi:hypothetical protein